ncbi:MAG TPA: hypothetical protein VMB05_13630, partial [Solirubrobacteraceae bacterium]|nr:hypothetical protein [Solirubrobacteraceae bacterium]
MFGSARFRPLGWVVALATLAAMAATMALAAPGGAAAPEKLYATQYTATCEIGPGVLNLRTTATFEFNTDAPESVQKGEQLSLREFRLALALPSGLTETMFSFGVRTIKGSVHLTISAQNAEPSTYKLTLPLKASVGGSGETVLASEPTAAGPFTVTGATGEQATFGVEA